MEKSTIVNRQAIYKWAIFHGYVSHNQRVISCTNTQAPLVPDSRNLQTPRNGEGMAKVAQTLWKEGGVRRFYRGFLHGRQVLAEIGGNSPGKKMKPHVSMGKNGFQRNIY